MTQTAKGWFTLHRYFIWADRMMVHFEDVLRSGKKGDDNFDTNSLLYMSYWYAGTYVVIEGWKELKLSDETVDGLLKSRNVDLLRKYRNGVFHFQEQYYDERRFAPLITEGDDVVIWIRTLREALGQYFLKRLAEARPS